MVPENQNASSNSHIPIALASEQPGRPDDRRKRRQRRRIDVRLRPAETSGCRAFDWPSPARVRTDTAPAARHVAPQDSSGKCPQDEQAPVQLRGRVADPCGSSPSLTGAGQGKEQVELHPECITWRGEEDSVARRASTRSSKTLAREMHHPEFPIFSSLVVGKSVG
jgi:hypothetical protein